MEFDGAVGELVEAIAASAPEAFRCERAVAAPETFGLVSSVGGLVGCHLSLHGPNGACRAVGLLPRVGRYEPVGEGGSASVRPRVITLGPAFVVTAAAEPEVAMTLEAEAPFLAAAIRALSLLDPYLAGRPWPKDPGVLRATRHPHYLALDLVAAGPPALDRVWSQGIDAVVWRIGEADGPPGEPHIVIHGTGP